MGNWIASRSVDHYVWVLSVDGLVVGLFAVLVVHSGYGGSWAARPSQISRSPGSRRFRLDTMEDRTARRRGSGGLAEEPVAPNQWLHI